MTLLLGFLATVVLASPFGQATATAIDDAVGLTVEITVAYDAAAAAMIVRPFSDYEELPPTAMAPQADGTWTAWVELPTAQNWQIAFEGFHPDGVSDISEATDLIAMGVDRVVIESEVVGPLPGKALIPDGSWWLVVAIGSVVAALAGLGYWAFASEPEPADLESSSAPQAEAANGRE